MFELFFVLQPNTEVLRHAGHTSRIRFLDPPATNHSGLEKKIIMARDFFCQNHYGYMGLLGCSYIPCFAYNGPTNVDDVDVFMEDMF